MSASLGTLRVMGGQRLHGQPSGKRTGPLSRPNGRGTASERVPLLQLPIKQRMRRPPSSGALSKESLGTKSTRGVSQPWRAATHVASKSTGPLGQWAAWAGAARPGGWKGGHPGSGWTGRCLLWLPGAQVPLLLLLLPDSKAGVGERRGLQGCSGPPPSPPHCLSLFRAGVEQEGRPNGHWARKPQPILPCSSPLGSGDGTSCWGPEARSPHPTAHGPHLPKALVPPQHPEIRQLAAEVRQAPTSPHLRPHFCL